MRVQLLLCTTAVAEAPSGPAGGGNEPRDGEDPLRSFPAYTWSDSSPHNPVPKFLNYTQDFNPRTGCYFYISSSAGFVELQKQSTAGTWCREVLCHPQWSSIPFGVRAGNGVRRVMEKRRCTGKPPRFSGKDLNPEPSA